MRKTNRDYSLMKGENNPSKRPEVRKLISEKMKGRDVSGWIHKVAEKLRGRKTGKRPEHSLFMKNLWKDENYRKNKILKSTGQKRSIETKLKISRALKNRVFSEKTIQKFRLNNKLSNNPMWKGGKSYEPYTPEFNNSLKNKVRELYKKCCICNKKPNKTLQVHHIDYDKKNNGLYNLVSLCNKCHNSTNVHRESWTNYFQDNKMMRILFEKEYLKINNFDFVDYNWAKNRINSKLELP